MKTPKKQHLAGAYPLISDTAPALECTGLTAKVPVSDAERAMYETLFSLELSQSEDEDWKGRGAR